MPKAHTSSSSAAAAPSCVSKTVAYWFVGEAEWQLIDATRTGSRARFALTEHDRLCFDAATPVMDGFRVKWFSIVEFAVQVALAVAEMVTQLVAANVSCVTSAVIQAVVLGAYLFLCVWLRPFQERFLRVTTPLMTAAQIVIVVIVAAMTSSGLPDWVDALVMVVVSIQSVLVIAVVLCSLGPLAAWARRVVQRYRLRKKRTLHAPPGRGAAGRSESRTTLRSLLREAVGLTARAREGDAVELRDVAAVLRPAAAAAERSSRTTSAAARRNAPRPKHVPPPSPPPRGSSLSRTNPRREESTAARRPEAARRPLPALPRNPRAGRPVSSRIAMEEI
jgi:hypothetical protein